MSRVPLLALIGFAGLLIAPGMAQAHGIESNLERLGGLSDRVDFSRTDFSRTDFNRTDFNRTDFNRTDLSRTTSGSRAPASRAPASRLQLESHFSSGMPASEAAVRLVPPNGGTPIEVGRTDTRGQLTFALPAQAGSDWEIQVDAGPGHRDYLELPGSEKTITAPRAGTLLPMAGSYASRWPILSPLVMFGLIGSVGALQLWRRR